MSKLLIAGMLWSFLATAHPLGNFSVSHYSKLEMKANGVSLFYVLDLAEIPTFELLQKWGVKQGNAISAVNQHAAAEAQRWVDNLSVTVDGKPWKLTLKDAGLSLSDGAANMPVARIEVWADAEGSPGKLEYSDKNYPDRAGWKEIVVASGSDGRILSSTAPQTEQSAALKQYPIDLSVKPPQMLQATVVWQQNRASQWITSAVPPDVKTVKGGEEPGSVVEGDFLSRLLGRKDIPPHLALLGIAVAFGLGAVHALSPGHGKAMVAAYLIGSRGTPRHALILGSMVTFTHTISVFLLGIVTLFLSRYITPEKLYPILGTISGLTIVWLGGLLLYRRAGQLAGAHVHSHDHVHAHAGHAHHHHHTHSHDGETHSHVPEGDVTMGSLIALGVSGGLVPCPSGLVLLLSSIALGKVALGLVLLTAFSAGLASVLIAVGLMVIYAKQWIPESKRTAESPLLRVVPILSAFVILLVGILMTGASLGWIKLEGWIE